MDRNSKGAKKFTPALYGSEWSRTEHRMISKANAPKLLRFHPDSYTLMMTLTQEQVGKIWHCWSTPVFIQRKLFFLISFLKRIGQSFCSKEIWLGCEISRAIRMEVISTPSKHMHSNALPLNLILCHRHCLQSSYFSSDLLLMGKRGEYE